jgi:pimeloyl-ACP methyl ester carboxylesterase
VAQPTVILVHGLWMAGFQLSVLKNRLEARSRFRVVAFSYPSVQGSMSDHARSLVGFARGQESGELHFVGHSLGGLVILRALQLAQDLPTGRVVLLGSPCQGSKAAQGVARIPFGKAILGGAVNEECIQFSPRQWSGHREVGVIAGSMRFGLGRLFADFESDHDGTVLVEETRLPGSKDHIVLGTTHTGMLLSGDVADQTVWFLEHGEFKRTT